MEQGLKRQLIRRAYLKRASHSQEVYLAKTIYNLKGDSTGNEPFAYDSGWGDVLTTLLRVPLSRLITLKMDDPIWEREGIRFGSPIGDSMGCFSAPQSWTPSDTTAVFDHADHAAKQALFNARHSWSPRFAQVMYSEDLPLYSICEITLSKPQDYQAYPIPNLYAELLKVKSLVEKPPRRVR